MPKWECKSCGNRVEAPRKPDHCPCGSEKIEEVEEGLLDELRNALGI